MVKRSQDGEEVQFAAKRSQWPRRSVVRSPIAEAFAVDTVRQRSRNASGTQSIASQSFAGDTLRRFDMAAANGRPTRTGVLAPTTRTPQKAEKVECPRFAFFELLLAGLSL